MVQSYPQDNSQEHAARFGVQWDRFLSGVVWAYRNTPHEATHEKPSYLLFGLDCRSPTEAALLPPTELRATDVMEYREQLAVSLSSGREVAAEAIRQAQKKYKKAYDKTASQRQYRVSEWVLVKFPADETGRMRKLSRPWHGLYRVVQVRAGARRGEGLPPPGWSHTSPSEQSHLAQMNSPLVITGMGTVAPHLDGHHVGLTGSCRRREDRDPGSDTEPLRIPVAESEEVGQSPGSDAMDEPREDPQQAPCGSAGLAPQRQRPAGLRQ